MSFLVKLLLLEVPATVHARRLSIVYDRRFKEIAFVAVHILQAIEVLIRIVDGLWVERINIEHRKPLVGEPLGVAFGRVTVETRDAVT